MTPKAPGSFVLRASVDNGSAYGTAYTKDFTINVPSVPVTDINASIPSTITINEPLTLTGTALPENSSYRDVAWTISDAGTTNASITNNVLKAPAPGTIKLTATVYNGKSAGEDFTKEYTVTVMPAGSELNIETGSITITSSDSENNLVIHAGYEGGSKVIPKTQTVVYQGNELWGRPITVKASDLSYTITELANGADYTFMIEAVNGIGSGASKKMTISIPKDTTIPTASPTTIPTSEPIAEDGKETNLPSGKEPAAHNDEKVAQSTEAPSASPAADNDDRTVATEKETNNGFSWLWIVLKRKPKNNNQKRMIRNFGSKYVCQIPILEVLAFLLNSKVSSFRMMRRNRQLQYNNYYQELTCFNCSMRGRAYEKESICACIVTVYTNCTDACTCFCAGGSYLYGHV